MKNFKLSVSKNGKKYTIVFKAETEKDARKKVHDEWYSILGIEEISSKEDIWNIFLFTAKTEDWSYKKWKIVWDDIFKVYVKLRKNLEYNVITLYSEENSEFTEEKKLSIISDLKEEYNLLFSWKKKDNLDKLREKIKKDKEENTKNKNFYLKKELTTTYELIDFILIKLEKLLSGSWWIKISVEQKEKIKNIYNSIIKLKKSTNISKLKIIWEAALLKIWEIELRELEDKHEDSSKDLLKETNSLLRKIGSRESFIEKDKDFWIKVTKVLNYFLNYLNKFKKIKKEEVDKHTHLYVRNMLFLKRYKEKLKENTLFILNTNIKLIFDKELRIDTFIKRKVIKQNIVLLKAKEKWIGYSYTFIKKWMNKVIDSFIEFIYNIRQYLFIVIFIYTLLFIFSLNINFYYNFYESNFEWIFYFIVVFFIYLILYIVRNFILMIFSFAILFIVVIFWVVNF